MLFPIASAEFLPATLIILLCSLLFLRMFTTIPKVLIFFIIFSSLYYLKVLFGLAIIPESMISFLALMCLARMLEKDKEDSKTNRYLGFLWIGCFVLFRTDLLSICLLLLTMFFIMKTMRYRENDLYYFRDLLKIKSLGFKNIAVSTLTVFVLFVFFPRAYNFLPSARVPQKGTIGYSKRIDNSSMTELLPSSQTAFYAIMSKIKNENLYWRGRVLNYTDGYNWKTTKIHSRVKNIKVLTDSIDYKVKYEQDFQGDLILLDIPLKVNNSNLAYTKNNEFNTFMLYNKHKKSFLDATSVLSFNQLNTDTKNLNKYTQLPGAVKNTLKKFTVFLKDHTSLEDLIVKFKKHIINNKYSYTLSPKGTTTLKGFIKNKQGFCTHYASLLGLTLRYFKYPARLISGFQGGQYNDIGNHYKVSSNDAHAWVEVYDGKRWTRIDPTSFIAPNRLIVGGESFLSGNSEPSILNNTNSIYSFYYSSKQIWDNLNFKISLFFDTYNMESQRTIANKFKINKNVFIISGFLLISIIFLIFYNISGKDNNYKEEVDIIFNKFAKKMKHKGIEINQSDNLFQIIDKVQSKDEIYVDFINAYKIAKYSKNKNLKDLKKVLAKIK